MTTENNELVVSELCARFPYTVYAYLNDKIVKLIDIHFTSRNEPTFTFSDGTKQYIGVDVDRIKLCLRPMKSMTPEEREDYEQTLSVMSDGLGTKITYTSYYAISWLIEHHFDYKDLIGKGLAIEATPKLYK